MTKQESIEPTQEQMAEAVYQFAADELVAGHEPAAVRGVLRQRGLDANSAAHIVSTLTNLGSSQRDAGARNMFFGAMWCLGGIVVTAVTYGSASEGGRYVIAYGAVIAGIVQFFRGIMQYAQAK